MSEEEMKLMRWRLEALERTVQMLASFAAAQDTALMDHVIQDYRKRFHAGLNAVPLHTERATPPWVYGRMLGLLGDGDPPEMDQLLQDRP